MALRLLPHGESCTLTLVLSRLTLLVVGGGGGGGELTVLGEDWWQERSVRTPVNSGYFPFAA
jgi:hypothetical protein